MLFEVQANHSYIHPPIPYGGKSKERRRKVFRKTPVVPLCRGGVFVLPRWRSAWWSRSGTDKESWCPRRGRAGLHSLTCLSCARLHAFTFCLRHLWTLTATPATSWQMTQHPAYDSSPDFSPNLGSDPPPAYGTSPLLLVITQISVLFRAQYMSNYSKICIFQMWKLNPRVVY